MLEAKAERDAVKWAKKRGWITYKLGGSGDRGKADRLFLHRRVIVFMEFKAPGEKPSKLQLWHARQLERVGYKTHFPTSCEEAITILEQVYEINNASELATEAISREGYRADAGSSSGRTLP